MGAIRCSRCRSERWNAARNGHCPKVFQCSRLLAAAKPPSVPCSWWLAWLAQGWQLMRVHGEIACSTCHSDVSAMQGMQVNT